MRKMLAIGVSLMTISLATAGTAVAEDAPAPPPGCNPSSDVMATSLDVEWSGLDPDCVTLEFTETPASTTMATSAKISWKAGAYGIKGGSNWANWRNKVCTLDGQPIDCDDIATIDLTNLPPGEHTFTVSGETPSPFTECQGEVCGSATDAVAITPCDPLRYACVKVYGDVKWTIAPQPGPSSPVTTAAPAAAPPAVVTAAAPAPVRVCTSRRGELTVRLRERKGKRIKAASVFFNGKKIAVATRNRTGRLTARISFDGLPAGRFSLKITATLASGKKVSFTRRYFTCEPKRPPSNKLSSANAL